jgi:hypothetical protein
LRFVPSLDRARLPVRTISQENRMSRADTASVTAPGETPTTGLADRVDPKASRVIWLLLAAAFVAILNETTMGVAIPTSSGTSASLPCRRSGSRPPSC